MHTQFSTKYFLTFFIALGLFLSPCLFAQVAGEGGIGCPVGSDEEKEWNLIWVEYIKSLENIPDESKRAEKAGQCVAALYFRLNLNELQTLMFVTGKNPKYQIPILKYYLEHKTSLYSEKLDDLASLLAFRVEDSAQQYLGAPALSPNDYAEFQYIIRTNLESTFSYVKNNASVFEARALIEKLKSLKATIDQSVLRTNGNLQFANQRQHTIDVDVFNGLLKFYQNIAEFLDSYLPNAENGVKCREDEAARARAAQKSDIQAAISERLLEKLKKQAECLPGTSR